MEPHSNSQGSQGPSRRSMVAARQAGLAGKNTTFQCYLWSISRGSTGHLRDLTSDTCPLQRIQLTAWGGLACQSPPSAGYKDQSSKCHSSSAVSPCLSRVRSYRVSSQPLETHRDCALNGRPQADVCQNTKGNPGKALLCQAGLLLTPAQVPPTALSQWLLWDSFPRATAEAALAHSQDQSPKLL